MKIGEVLKEELRSEILATKARNNLLVCASQQGIKIATRITKPRPGVWQLTGEKIGEKVTDGGAVKKN